MNSNIFNIEPDMDTINPMTESTYDPLADDIPYIPTLKPSNQSTTQVPLKPMTESYIDETSMNTPKPQLESPVSDVDVKNAFSVMHKQLSTKPVKTLDTAIQNKNNMSDIVAQLRNVLSSDDLEINTVDGIKQNTNSNNIDISITTLVNAIETLKTIDAWIPKAKESFAPRLSKVAVPIINALESYVSTLEKMK